LCVQFRCGSRGISIRMPHGCVAGSRESKSTALGVAVCVGSKLDGAIVISRRLTTGMKCGTLQPSAAEWRLVSHRNGDRIPWTHGSVRALRRRHGGGCRAREGLDLVEKGAEIESIVLGGRARYGGSGWETAHRGVVVCHGSGGASGVRRALAALTGRVVGEGCSQGFQKARPASG